LRVQATVDAVEAAVDVVKASVLRVEATVDAVQAAIDAVEPLIDPVDSPTLGGDLIADVQQRAAERADVFPDAHNRVVGHHHGGKRNALT
jgi:hypothetical protein